MEMNYNFDMVFPNIKSIGDKDNENHVIYEIEPLERGFGTTVGNAMRRVALSSLPGGAITMIEIKGVSSEYDVLPAIVEDITTLILAVKNISVRVEKQDVEHELILKGDKKGDITAGMISTPVGVEIINKDLKLATLAIDTEFEMKLTAIKGDGYRSAAENRGKEKRPNTIYVDSIFTPVKQFSYTVVDTRVGDKTNYDKLIIDLETNGMVSPDEAISYSANVIKEHMLLLENIEQSINKSQVFVEDKNEEIEETIQEDKPEESKIETLDISNRAYNGLKRAHINTIEELVSKSKRTIATLDNIGIKTVDEIEKQLEELGYNFKD